MMGLSSICTEGERYAMENGAKGMFDCSCSRKRTHNCYDETVYFVNSCLFAIQSGYSFYPDQEEQRWKEDDGDEEEETFAREHGRTRTKSLYVVNDRKTQVPVITILREPALHSSTIQGHDFEDVALEESACATPTITPAVLSGSKKSSSRALKEQEMRALDEVIR
jgi:hypothetical protein